MTPADVPALVPYFARVARRLAHGPDADDLLSVALLTVFLRMDAINRHPDPDFAAKRCGVWAMLADRKRMADRARRTLSLDFDHGREDDRDGFDDLLALAGTDADLLRRRFGEGQTLRDLAGDAGTTPAAITRRIDARLSRMRRRAIR